MSFDDRQRGEEKRFELDQELEFKAQARRAKLVGLWAAGLIGLKDQEAADYAKSVVVADLEEAGSEDLSGRFAPTSTSTPSNSPTTRSGRRWTRRWPRRVSPSKQARDDGPRAGLHRADDLAWRAVALPAMR